MRLQLKSSKVSQLYFSKPENSETFFNLDYFIQKINTTNFSVEFKLEIIDPDVFEMGLVYNSIFEADSSLPEGEDFENNKFFSQNAPAIAYPYLRAFVSTVMLNAGYPPLMLPSVNFVELNKKKKDSQNSKL